MQKYIKDVLAAIRESKLYKLLDSLCVNSLIFHHRDLHSRLDDIEADVQSIYDLTDSINKNTETLLSIIDLIKTESNMNGDRILKQLLYMKELDLTKANYIQTILSNLEILILSKNIINIADRNKTLNDTISKNIEATYLYETEMQKINDKYKTNPEMQKTDDE